MDGAGDLIDGHHAVDGRELAPLGIVVNQRFRLAPVAGESLGQDLRGVIEPDLFPALAHLGDASLDAIQERAFVDAELDHGIELEVLVLEQLIQRLIRGTVRGKPSRMKPFWHPADRSDRR